MSDEIAAFIKARIAEDEAAARDAVAPWNDEANEYELADLPDEITRHIALHDPARVLREVAALRAVVELHKLTVEKQPQTPNDPLTGEPQTEYAYEATCDVCGWASDDPTSGCDTLRHLAAIWADHPEYRAEWRP